MLRYIFVLLLVNASYRSLGNPIKPTTTVSLVNLLTTLADHCENAFLSDQIKNKLSYCSDLSSPHGEKQLQCLIFYDMSQQLCAAVGAAKIALPQADYTSKINEEQDVNTLCISAKDWIFTNLTEFSHYLQAVNKVFKHPVTCGKICGGEDFMSDDSNFFCKYYKWGTDVLKPVPQVTSTQLNAQLPPEAINVDNKEPPVLNNDLQDVQIKETSSTNAKTNTPIVNNPVKNDPQPKVEAIKPETSSQAANQKSQSVEPGSISNVVAMPDVEGNPDTSVDNVEDTGAIPENNYAEDQPSKSPEGAPVQAVLGAVTKAKAVEDERNKPEDTQKNDDKELQLLNNDLDNKQPVLETPKGKPQNEIEDYPGIDSEEGKDGLSDIQGGDDGDDPNLGDLADDLKPAKKPEAIESSLPEEKDNVYVNPAQEAFPEGDDHFFPFFLTAIILVVLLYVLYHNKNKVGKVFFGLMVEGRQASRRRNSRGHAYKRLDTLEQAMSASSAAPPSKIIY